MRRMKKVLTYVVIMLVAAVGALNYELFVFPNRFAPAGLNGICTLIQHLSGINVGYMSLLINIPLAIAVYFKISHSLAVRSMVYVVVFSIVLVVFDYVDISAFAYETQYSAILGPLVAGIITGAGYSLLVRASAYSGGMDFVASLIHRSLPHINFFWTVFALNIVVAALSFFVYGYKIEPVLLCIIYSFTASTVSDKLNKSGRSAVRFEIITNDPQALSEAIIRQLHHSATLIPGKGMYHGKPKNILICVVNRTQSAAMANIIRQHPGTFAVMSQVSEVMGNFRRFDTHGNAEVTLLDEGDGAGI